MTGHTVRRIAGTSEDIMVVALDGEVDVSNARAVGDELIAAVPHNAVGLVVDLRLLRYIDSSGVSMLFELVRRLELVRRQLGLFVPTESPVRKLIEVTGIDAVAVVSESVDDCLDTIREKAADGLG